MFAVDCYRHPLLNEGFPISATDLKSSSIYRAAGRSKRLLLYNRKEHIRVNSNPLTLAQNLMK